MTASLEVMVLPVETQGLQVIVLDHLEVTAMKITLVASQKESAVKLLPSPELVHLRLGIARDGRSVCDVMFHTCCHLTLSIKVTCIYVFYSLAFQRLP